MKLQSRVQKIFAAAAFAIALHAGNALAINGTDGTEQLGALQATGSETDATLQVNYDPEPKVTSVTVSSNALTLTGSGSAAGSVDIGDLNVADGFDLVDSFNVVIAISDTATANELLNLQAGLIAAPPSGMTIQVEVDQTDIPSVNDTLAGGAAGSGAALAVADLTLSSTLANMVTDLDDDDGAVPAGGASSITLPVDMKLAIDSTVTTTPGNFTMRYRALFE